jgi:hypothetical protein
MTQEAFGLQDNSAGESAERTRRAINFMLARGATIGSVLGGLVAATDLQVTYQGSGLKIEVAQGEAIIPGNVSATQSGYYFRNTAAATFTLAAANGSNPRIERIVATVFDESYEGSKNEAKIEVKEGTAKAGATLTNLEGVAAAPKNSITLAYVLVPAAATTITNTDIRNVASRVLGSLVQLAVVIAASNVTAQYGQLIESSGPITVKLPAAAGAVSQRVGAAAGGGAVTVECVNGEEIFGDFLQGVTSCSLAVRQHVEFISDGLNWLIVAGEPQRPEPWGLQNNYTQAEGVAGKTPNAIRPVAAVFNLTTARSERVEVTIKIGSGGVASLRVEPSTNEQIFSLSVPIIPPGVAWKLNVTEGSLTNVGVCYYEL